jgi:hypothetical protein
MSTGTNGGQLVPDVALLATDSSRGQTKPAWWP